MTQESLSAVQTPDRFLRIEAVLHRTGLSRATLYRKVQQGTFPKQVRIAERCVGWRESAVNDWQRNASRHGRANPGMASGGISDRTCAEADDPTRPAAAPRAPAAVRHVSAA